MTKKVVIVGAGFAGLSALLVLRKRRDLDIKIIDKDEFFEYTPSLHLCIGNRGYVDKIRVSLKKYYGEHYIKGKVTTILAKKLITDNGEHDYDYLVLATGSVTNYYGRQDFKKHSLALKRISDVDKINERLKSAGKVILVGGGYTGVEAATIIAKLKKQNLSVVHSKERLLDTLDAKAGNEAKKYFDGLGSTIYLGKKVVECKEDCVNLDSGDIIKTDMTIMTAGVKPNILVDHEISSDFSLKGHENIFVCGDCADTPSIKTAHNAMIEGREVGEEIASRLDGKKRSVKKRNWKILAVAFGRHDGMITWGKKSIRMPFTGFLKWIVEQRVLFEFKYKVMLPI